MNRQLSSNERVYLLKLEMVLVNDADIIDKSEFLRANFIRATWLIALVLDDRLTTDHLKEEQKFFRDEINVIREMLHDLIGCPSVRPIQLESIA